MTAPVVGVSAWRNWARDQRCAPAAIERPTSIAEIAAALERAAAHGQRVRVAGAGHSFSDIALTDGRLLRLDRMNRLLEVDRASGLVRVQGGITIHALNARLAAIGLALENLGDIDVQSIAGAISTATHGTGARLRNIPSQVAALTLVLADGSTLRCSEQRRSRAAARRARRAGRARRGRGGDAALRARLPPEWPRRPRATGADARALRGAGARQRPLRILRLPPRPHGADAHQQPHRGAGPPARAG